MYNHELEDFDMQVENCINDQNYLAELLVKGDFL
jgi:hypothetical protein